MSFEKLKSERQNIRTGENRNIVPAKGSPEFDLRKKHEYIICLTRTLELISLLEELSQIVDVTVGVRLCGIINDLKNQTQHSLTHFRGGSNLRFRSFMGGLDNHRNKYSHIDELRLLIDLINEDKKSLDKSLLMEKPRVNFRQEYGRTYEVLLSSILFLISTEMRSSGESDEKKQAYGLGVSVKPDAILINGEKVGDTTTLPHIIEEKILGNEVIQIAQAINLHGHK